MYVFVVVGVCGTGAVGFGEREVERKSKRWNVTIGSVVV